MRRRFGVIALLVSSYGLTFAVSYLFGRTGPAAVADRVVGIVGLVSGVGLAGSMAALCWRRSSGAHSGARFGVGSGVGFGARLGARRGAEHRGPDALRWLPGLTMAAALLAGSAVAGVALARHPEVAGTRDQATPSVASGDPEAGRTPGNSGAAGSSAGGPPRHRTIPVGRIERYREVRQVREGQTMVITRDGVQTAEARGFHFWNDHGRIWFGGSSAYDLPDYGVDGGGFPTVRPADCGSTDPVRVAGPGARADLVCLLVGRQGTAVMSVAAEVDSLVRVQIVFYQA